MKEIVIIKVRYGCGAYNARVLKWGLRASSTTTAHDAAEKAARKVFGAKFTLTECTAETFTAEPIRKIINNRKK